MITVAGLTPSLDVTYLVDRLRPGHIHRPYEVHRRAGGKPLNLARSAAALGHPPTVVAVLGGPTGDGLRADLQHVGITVRTVTSPVETRICTSVAGDEDEALTEFYALADPLPADVWTAFGTELDRALAESTAGSDHPTHDRRNWLAIAGGPPRGLPDTGLAELVALGRRHGVRVALDTHGPALRRAVAAGPDLIKVNREEAAGLLDLSPDTDLVRLADGVADLAVAAGADPTRVLVVLTDGAAGALARTHESVTRAALPGHLGRFPVGSGDAFLGGLLSGLTESDDIKDAIRLAAAAGTANALVPGAGEFDGAVARSLVRDVVTEVLR